MTNLELVEKLHYEQLLEKTVNLLDSGDDTGCDGLVVGAFEFVALQELVKELTGITHGSLENFDTKERECCQDAELCSKGKFEVHFNNDGVWNIITTKDIYEEAANSVYKLMLAYSTRKFRIVSVG